MLDFLRKFQKIFFVAVALILIFSFLFFGVFSTLPTGEHIPDQEVGKGVDGSSISLLTRQKLMRLLAAEVDPKVSLFHDEILVEDFLKSGIGSLLVTSYFENFKDDLDVRLKRVKAYVPYAHPDAPFLSAQAIWDQFCPNLSKSLAHLKGQLEVSSATFDHLADLYLAQKQMSPELVRRILFYQMEQFPSIRPDPSLRYVDFSLLGYKNIRDWFGEKWLEKAADFICNSALVAKEKGIFKVSKEEAKADLLLRAEAKQISVQSALNHLGMSESELCETWQNVLLFRLYINSVGDSLLVDHLFSDDLAAFTSKKVVTDMYSLPDLFVLKGPEDLFALQHYLEKTSVFEKDSLLFPKTYRPLEDVLKEAPQFVETSFKAKVSRASKAQLALRTPLKQVLEWTLDHWEELTKHFKSIELKGESREERFAVLDRLDATERRQIDSWVRQRLVDEHPEWVEEALQAAEPVEQIFSFFADRVNVSYVKDPSSFFKTLEAATQGSSSAELSLGCYSGPGSSCYRISHVEKLGGPKIRTFAAMKEDGTLLQELRRHLEKHYAKLKETDRSKFISQASGDFKPFTEVKEEIGWLVYGDLRKAIETKEKLNSSTEPVWKHRFSHAMRMVLKEIQETGLEPSILDQFCLVKEEKIWERKDPMAFAVFSILPHQWSSVHIFQNGLPFFCYVKEELAPSESNLNILTLNKKMLAKEAKQLLAKRLIHRMQSGVK